VGKINDREFTSDAQIYIYIYIKLEDIVFCLPCGIYGNVFISTCVILLGQIYIYIKLEDIAISLPCGIDDNVFISTRVILLEQIIPRESTHVILLEQITPRESTRIILLRQITPAARILLVKYKILYDILKLLMNYINMNLNVSINLTN
jgi:hypothetical protein